MEIKNAELQGRVASAPSVRSESETRHFFKGCHRIMKLSTLIHNIVPDAGAYVRAAQAKDWDELTRLRKLHNGRKDPAYQITYQTAMQLLNVLFRQFSEHKYAYDGETLIALLEEVGFRQATVTSFGQSRMAELAIDLEQRASESLYVEAVR